MRIFALAALIACFAFSASATSLLVDNFDSYATGDVAAPGTFGPWSVTVGSVDALNSFPGITCQGGTTGCVDMAGTEPGTIQWGLTYTGGVTYTLTFWASGNQRSDLGTQSLTVTLGTETLTVNRISTDPWEQYTLTFAPSAGGSGNLEFAMGTAGNIGILLDTVSLADDVVIPEPATLGLLGAGLGALGLIRRRR